MFCRKKGGIQVLAGLTPSGQTVVYLLRTLKIGQNSEFGEFAPIEKCKKKYFS
jgi:hypothetical protein